MVEKNIPATRADLAKASPAQTSPVQTSPIAVIARADQRKASRDGISGADVGVDSDLVEPFRPLAPQGLSAVLDRSLGSVRLPSMLELANALEDMMAHTDQLAEVDPSLAEVGKAVLADEQGKLMRYLDIKNA